MLNRISAIGNYTQFSKPSFKSTNEDTKTSMTNPQQEMVGLQALANYGAAVVTSPKKPVMTPVDLILKSANVTDDIKGERIFNSDGKIYSIVDEDETTKTTYKINDDSLVSNITVVNKESGILIKEQNNLFSDGELNTILVKEFSPNTGKIVKSSHYNEGELTSISNYSKNKKNGLDEIISYYPKDKEYSISQQSPNKIIDNYASISEDMKYITVEKSKNLKNKTITKTANFYNGALISVEENKKTIVPNLIGKEPLFDKDLTPAKKYNLESIKPDFDGEKTYFSTGAVESIKTADGTAFFTPDGKVSKLVSPKMEINLYDDGAQQIKEFLDENITRTTIYDKDGISIEYSDSKNFKNLVLTPKSKPSLYYEGYFEEDGDREWTKSYYYNSQGLLESAHNC